jgi:hypothetical protein
MVLYNFSSNFIFPVDFINNKRFPKILKKIESNDKTINLFLIYLLKYKKYLKIKYF